MIGKWQHFSPWAAHLDYYQKTKLHEKITPLKLKFCEKNGHFYKRLLVPIWSHVMEHVLDEQWTFVDMGKSKNRKVKCQGGQTGLSCKDSCVICACGFDRWENDWDSQNHDACDSHDSSVIPIILRFLVIIMILGWFSRNSQRFLWFLLFLGNSLDSWVILTIVKWFSNDSHAIHKRFSNDSIAIIKSSPTPTHALHPSSILTNPPIHPPIHWPVLVFLTTI